MRQTMTHPRIRMEKPKPLSKAIADEVKEAIAKGQLQPGEQLLESVLTKSLDVSRTPLREAFRQLEAEGYVTIVPHKGTFVSSLSKEEVSDFYTIMGVLEGLATRLATPTLRKEEERGRLLALFEVLQEQSARGDVNAYWGANKTFHEFISELSGNDRLIHLINNLRPQMMKTRALTLHHKGRLESSMMDHREILEAILGGDTERAERLVVQHFEKQRRFVLDLMEELPDP